MILPETSTRMYYDKPKKLQKKLRQNRWKQEQLTFKKKIGYHKIKYIQKNKYCTRKKIAIYTAKITISLTFHIIFIPG